MGFKQFPWDIQELPIELSLKVHCVELPGMRILRMHRSSLPIVSNPGNTRYHRRPVVCVVQDFAEDSRIVFNPVRTILKRYVCVRVKV